MTLFMILSSLYQYFTEYFIEYFTNKIESKLINTKNYFLEKLM